MSPPYCTEATRSHAMKIRAFIPAFLPILLLSQIPCYGVNAADGRGVLSGVVTDNFGHPLEDVIVTVKDFDFQSKSGNLGDYKIGYVPGTISINYEKRGYQSAVIKLELGAASDVPLRRVVLIKAPPPNTLS